MSRLRRSNSDDKFADAGSRTDAENIRIKRQTLREQRAELAGGEVFQGAEAGVEFGGREAALAVESAQKIPRRTVGLAEVAFRTGGNQVAVGVAAEADAGHNVVEAPDVGGSAAEAIKAGAAFAIVNGFAERAGFHEGHGFEGSGRRFHCVAGSGTF